MPDFLRPLAGILCVPLLFVSACDQPEDTGRTEFRGIQTQCGVATQGSTVFKWGGNGHGPLPFGPDTGDPWVPLDELPPEFIDALQQDFRGQADAVLVGMFEADERAISECAGVCAEMGVRWTGNGCIAEGAYDFGEIGYAESTYLDQPRYAMEVYVDAQLGCSCFDR